MCGDKEYQSFILQHVFQENYSPEIEDDVTEEEEVRGELRSVLLPTELPVDELASLRVSYSICSSPSPISSGVAVTFSRSPSISVSSVTVCDDSLAK